VFEEMIMRAPSLLLLTAGWLVLVSQLSGQATDPKQIAADEKRLQAAGLKIDDAALLEFLRKRTLTDDERSKVQVLISQLGAVAFRTREKASADLIAKGPVVMELLKQGINDPDLEISRRCEMCLQKIKEHDVPDVPAAVVRLLAARKTAGAVEVLLACLPFVDGEAVADEVRNALTALAVQDGKVNKALVAALTDKMAPRRGAAGEVLVRAGVKEHYKAVQALLQDTDINVRWRVAMALVLAKDKDAVPELIGLLPGASQAQAWQIEDILYRLADGKTPPAVALGVNEAGRKKCRDAWLTWWKEHGKAVDLAVLQLGQRLLGYTTIVLLDKNSILELDGNDNVRWQIDDVKFPLDIQVLPGDRVLVAEYHGNHVKEFNFKGEVLWKHYFDGPQMAQRLANGNTFMAGRNVVMEVDPAGNKVLLTNLGNGAGIMKCMKAPNNEIVCLFEDGKVARFDAQGKELTSFHVDLGMKLFGGRIHALANGNVLIPHHLENKVVEYNANGKMIWQVRIDQPIAAVRLPNGNTIVTSMNQNRAVEFDPSGKEVWQYRQNTRVTRAIRR
jgi:HEAT repeat protein